jgi:N-acetylglucosamine repressor
MSKGDLALLKNTNMTTVLDKIRAEGTVSRAHISRLTGLSRSTCSILVVDLSGKIIEIQSESFSKSSSKSTFIDILSKVVLSLTVHEKINTNEKIRGIGIGVGGKIDSNTGTLLESSIINMRNLKIGKVLEEITGIPVYLENDVNAFTVGEKYFGSGLNYHNLLCVTLGDGIGAGIIVDDNLFRGSHHIAGEFGHIRITNSSTAVSCTCGKKGCLEAYSSDHAIIGYFLELSGEAKTIEEITSLAESENNYALQAFVKAGTYLGYGLSTLINLFDPETIIIGGEGAVYYKFMESEINRVVMEDTVYGLFDEVKIQVVLFDDTLWIRGVAALVVKEVFRKQA